MLHVNLNEEKNGIEVSFDTRPDKEAIAYLKEAGFRWHHEKKMWYAKQSKERMDLLQSLSDGSEKFCAVNNTAKKHDNCVVDIWTLTRTDGIENNYEKTHLHDCKEIAAIIRKHIRERFKMCKWSVRSDTHSISVHMTSSPFDADSDIAQAIAHYVYCFANSYNYDNSDSMSDYFDVNFYGVYEYGIIDKYHYEQTEQDISDIVDLFEKKKTEFEAAEKDRIAREAKEAHELELIRKAEMEAENERIKAEHEQIENACVVCNNVDYFVLNVHTARINKLGSVNEINKYIEQDGDVTRENARVTREVYMTQECYSMFENQLMNEFSFLQGMGGTSTMDLRVKSMMDYEAMNSDERETVEWYCNECVAIFCENKMMLVIDPQGFSYARYTYIVDEESIVDKDYSASKGISDEEYQDNLEKAEILEDISCKVIMEQELRYTWNKLEFDVYKTYIKSWIRINKFKFSIGVIQAVKSELVREAMYRIYNEMKSLPEQFERAHIDDGQRITLIGMGEFGGVLTNCVSFHSYTPGKYAQYDKAVKLVYIPRKKRGQYYNWYHGDLIVVDGWIDLPESLFWEEIDGCGMRMKKTKYLSFDKRQLDTVLDYLKSIGSKILVNSFKPEFIN